MNLTTSLSMNTECRLNETKIKIRTEDQYYGWVATLDSYDGPGSPIGQGQTEQAAINDLLDLIQLEKYINALAKTNPGTWGEPVNFPKED